MLPFTPYDYWRQSVTFWSRAAETQVSMARMTLDTMERAAQPFPLAQHTFAPARLVVEAMAKTTAEMGADAEGPAQPTAQTAPRDAPQSAAYAREATRTAEKINSDPAPKSSGAKPRPAASPGTADPDKRMPV